MYIYTVYPSHSYFFLSPAWSHKTARGDVTGQAVEIDAPDWIMFDMVRSGGGRSSRSYGDGSWWFLGLGRYPEPRCPNWLAKSDFMGFNLMGFKMGFHDG
jgi:hypothetical protein